MAQDFLPARYDWGEVVTAPVSVEGARDAADVDCLSVLSNCPLNCGQTAPENIDKVHKNTIEGTVYSSPLHLFVGEFFNYSYNMDQKKAPNAVDPNTHPLVCLGNRMLSKGMDFWYVQYLGATLFLGDASPKPKIIMCPEGF